MNTILTQELATQRVAELHQQADRQRTLRLARAVRAASPAGGRARSGWSASASRRVRPVAC